MAPNLYLHTGIVWLAIISFCLLAGLSFQLLKFLFSSSSPRKDPVSRKLFVSIRKDLNKPSLLLFSLPSFFLPIPPKRQSPTLCKGPLRGAGTMSHRENPPLPRAVSLVASSVAGMPPSVFTASNFECADTENSDHRVYANQRGRENRCRHVKATLGFSAPLLRRGRPVSARGGWERPGWHRREGAHLLLLFLASAASSQCFYFGG